MGTVEIHGVYLHGVCWDAGSGIIYFPVVFNVELVGVSGYTFYCTSYVGTSQYSVYMFGGGAQMQLFALSCVGIADCNLCVGLDT